MKFDNTPFTLYDKSITIPSEPLIERMVLGIMLGSAEHVETGMQLLEESYFPNIDNNNRAIFYAMKELHHAQTEIDLVTVSQKLKSLKYLDIVGGLDYLSAIAEEAITYSAMKDYCLKLKDVNLLRNTLKVIDTNMEAYRQGRIGEVNEYISDLSREITKVAEERRIADFESLADIGKDFKSHLERMRKSGSGKLVGLGSNFIDFDGLTHGFQEDNYIIIAARPSVGKTAFALSLAYNTAKTNNKTVGFFSLEMANVQLMQRLVSKVSNIPHKKITEGRMNDVDRAKMDDTLNNLERVKLFIDETPGININDLLIKARKLKREHDDLAVIFIDYIGLITTSGRPESRQIELSEISAALKGLARELKITVIALSQLSRSVESRPDKRPQMSDLRESGSLEQDADIVVLMYREDYYVVQGSIKPTNAVYQAYYETLRGTENETNISPVDIIVAKNRNGETGNVVLMFFKAISSFENPDTGTLASLKNMQLANRGRKSSSEEWDITFSQVAQKGTRLS